MARQAYPTPGPNCFPEVDGLYEQPFPVPGIDTSQITADTKLIVGFIDHDLEVYGVTTQVGATVIDLASRRKIVQPPTVDLGTERFAA